MEGYSTGQAGLQIHENMDHSQHCENGSFTHSQYPLQSGNEQYSNNQNRYLDLGTSGVSADSHHWGDVLSFQGGSSSGSAASASSAVVKDPCGNSVINSGSSIRVTKADGPAVASVGEDAPRSHSDSGDDCWSPSSKGRPYIYSIVDKALLLYLNSFELQFNKHVCG